MTKITPDHLARGAFIYIRQSTADQLANKGAGYANMDSPIAPAFLLGPMSESLMTILAALARASAVRASSDCLRRSARAIWVLCSPLRRRVWREMGVTGTR